MKKVNLLLAVVMSMSIGVAYAMKGDDASMYYSPSSHPEHLLFRKILCTEVPLPKVMDLRYKLDQAGFAFFNKSEDIHFKLYGYCEEFGHYPLLPREIITVITACIIKYNEQLECKQDGLTHSDRWKILKIVFCKAPDVQNLLRFKQLGLNDSSYIDPQDSEKFELGLWYNRMCAKLCTEKNAKL